MKFPYVAYPNEDSFSHIMASAIPVFIDGYSGYLLRYWRDRVLVVVGFSCSEVYVFVPKSFLTVNKKDPKCFTCNIKWETIADC